MILLRSKQPKKIVPCCIHLLTTVSPHVSPQRSKQTTAMVSNGRNMRGMTTPMSCPPQALHLNIKTAAAAAIARDAWMATSTKKATTSYNAASAIIQKHQNLL